MRLHFLDKIRGYAIILMIIFHIFVTANIFNSDYYNLNSTPLYEIGFYFKKIHSYYYLVYLFIYHILIQKILLNTKKNNLKELKHY